MSEAPDFPANDLTPVDVSTIPTAGSSDLTPGPSLDLSGLTSSAPASFLSLPVDLPAPAPSSTPSSLLASITKLVTGVYQGEAQITAAQSNAALAKAVAAKQLQTVTSAPNIWLVLGLAGAGLVAIRIADSGGRK